MNNGMLRLISWQIKLDMNSSNHMIGSVPAWRAGYNYYDLYGSASGTSIDFSIDQAVYRNMLALEGGFRTKVAYWI